MEAAIARPPASLSVSMSSASAGARSAGGAEFTADDLAAADQLVQLSFSGGGDEDDDGEEDHREAFSSSSARSVNYNAQAAAAARGEEEEEDSGVVDRRAKKRYRLVSDLYAATKQVKAGTGAGKSKRKSSRGVARN